MAMGNSDKLFISKTEKSAVLSLLKINDPTDNFLRIYTYRWMSML